MIKKKQKIWRRRKQPSLTIPGCQLKTRDLRGAFYCFISLLYIIKLKRTKENVISGFVIGHLLNIKP